MRNIFILSFSIFLNLTANLVLADVKGACPAGLKKFPFLKEWAAKLDNFETPLEVGMTEESFLYAIGATYATPRASEVWMKAQGEFPVVGGKKDSRVESSWLGILNDQFKDGKVSAVLKSPFPAAFPVGSWDRLLTQLYSDAERELLFKCAPKNCKIKFNDPETKLITGSTGEYRIAQFNRILRDRVSAFQKSGEIFSYEGTSTGMAWQDLLFPKSFPTQINTHFWLTSDRTHYGYEILDPQPGRHKPVVGFFARQCEKRTWTGKDAEYLACSDLVLYNNHYFDFWARAFYFFPWCDQTLVLGYETLDVDQIKDSKIAYLVFGSEMRKLLSTLLETRLKRVNMLSSGP